MKKIFNSTTIGGVSFVCSDNIFVASSFWWSFTPSSKLNLRSFDNMMCMGQKRKKKVLPFFIPEDANLTSKLLFWMLTLGHICCSFAFLLVSISLIQGWIVEGTLSIKILVLCPRELEFCVLRKAKKILKHKILHDEQVFWSNSLNAYSNDIVYLL